MALTPSPSLLGAFCSTWLQWSLLASGVAAASQGSDGYEAPPFGAEVRRRFFQFGPGFLNFNHGGFGATPRPVREAMEAFTDRMEAQPTRWFGRDGYRAVLDKIRPAVARLLGANSSDVVFLDNASSGLVAVLRSLAWKRGDILLVTDAAYAVIPNTADWLEKRYGIRVLRVRIRYPVTGPETYTDPVRQLLDSLPLEDRAKIRLAIFDHISSYPAVLLPVTQLAQLVKGATGGQALVLLDGAHAPGQTSVDLHSLRAAGVDFYVGDGHKWLLSPRGSGLLWAAPHVQASLEPAVISSDNAPGTAFQERFDYIGTRDYTPWCAVGSALDFRREALGGEERILRYIHDLAVWAGQMLASLFRTEVLAPPSMTPAMIDVRLPIPLSWPAPKQRSCAEAVGTELAEAYQMQLIAFTLQSAVADGGVQMEKETHWARISAQVYLEKADFQLLGSRILSIVSKCHGNASSPSDVLQV